MKFKSLAAGLAFIAGSAAAQTFTLVPAHPEAFDPLVLRMTVDSCVYDIDAIGVRKHDDVLLVTSAVRNCLVPGPLRVIHVRLCTFPVGRYRVVLTRALADTVYAPPAAPGGIRGVRARGRGPSMSTNNAVCNTIKLVCRAADLSQIAPDANDKFAYLLDAQLKASPLLSTNSGIVGSLSQPKDETVTVPVVVIPRRPIKL